MRTVGSGVWVAIFALQAHAQAVPWNSLPLPAAPDDQPSQIRPQPSSRPAVVSIYSLGERQSPQAQKDFRAARKMARTGRHREAAAALAKIVESAPLYIEARNDLALELDALGSIDAATTELGAIIQTRPDYFLAYTNLAVLLYQHQRFMEAEAVVRKGMAKLGPWPKANLVLGAALVAQNHWTDEARSCLERAKPYYKTAVAVLRAWPK